MNVRSVIDEYRKDEPFMDRIAATLGIVALVFLSITLLRLTGGYVFAAPQALSSPSRVGTPTHEPAEAATFSPDKLASMVTACMNGRQFVWTDPHTGADMAVFCHVEILGMIGR
jgi:hypothetical protein